MNIKCITKKNVLRVMKSNYVILQYQIFKIGKLYRLSFVEKKVKLHM